MDTEQTEAERVEAMRLSRLLYAGYLPADAEQIAARLDIDLHRAEDLVKRGCDAVTAALILV